MSHVTLVEGNIASGKTTFCKKLQAEQPHDVIVHTERVSPTLLRMFYADPGRYAFALQLVQQQHRARMFADALAANQPHVLDRSIIGDWAFAAWNRACGNLTADEWQVYTEQAGGPTLEHILRNPPAGGSGGAQRPQVVYMRDGPEACFERARRRNAAQEAGADAVYFYGLHAAHELAMRQAVAAGLTVLQVDWQQTDRAASDVLAHGAVPFAPSDAALDMPGNVAVAQRLRALFRDI